MDTCTLQSITGKDVRWGDSLHLESCPQITSLSPGLSELTGDFQGGLNVNGMDGLVTLAGLEKITSVKSGVFSVSISVYNNSKLESALALQNVKYDNDLGVFKNPELLCTPSQWPAEDGDGNTIPHIRCPIERCTGKSVGLPQHECAAWQELHDSTGGYQWFAIELEKPVCRDNRLTPCDCTDSDKRKVVCEDNHITYIDLHANNLNGTLPLAFKNMTKLTEIFLDMNFLHGELPSLNFEQYQQCMITCDDCGRPGPLWGLHTNNFSCPLPKGAEKCVTTTNAIANERPKTSGKTHSKSPLSPLPLCSLVVLGALYRYRRKDKNGHSDDDALAPDLRWVNVKADSLETPFLRRLQLSAETERAWSNTESELSALEASIEQQKAGALNDQNYRKAGVLQKRLDEVKAKRQEAQGLLEEEETRELLKRESEGKSGVGSTQQPQQPQQQQQQQQQRRHDTTLTEQLGQILASAQSRAQQNSLRQTEIEEMQQASYDHESDPPFSDALASAFVSARDGSSDGDEQGELELNDDGMRVVGCARIFSAMSARQHRGRWETQEIIGAGGAGVVVRANDKVLKQTVAVKVVMPAQGGRFRAEEGKRLRREAHAMNRINHPSIARLHDSFLDDDKVHLLVMEYVTGRSLHDVIQSDGPCAFSQSKLNFLTEMVLGALCEMHSKNIIHLDIKPANIMLMEDRAD
eukprot:g651.t1